MLHFYWIRSSRATLFDSNKIPFISTFDWHSEFLCYASHSNFLLKQTSQPSPDLSLESTHRLPGWDFTSLTIPKLLLTYFRFRVTFHLGLSAADAPTLPTWSSGLSWPSRYRHCSLFAIFPGRQEGISLCSRLETRGMVERVQLLFTCNSGQSNPLRLPEGLGEGCVDSLR